MLVTLKGQRVNKLFPRYSVYLLRNKGKKFESL